MGGVRTRRGAATPRLEAAAEGSAGLNPGTESWGSNSRRLTLRSWSTCLSPPLRCAGSTGIPRRGPVFRSEPSPVVARA